MDPGSPPPKKFKRVYSAGKSMASTFWDSQGAIMIDYLEQGGTINGALEAATPGIARNPLQLSMSTQQNSTVFDLQTPL